MNTTDNTQWNTDVVEAIRDELLEVKAQRDAAVNALRDLLIQYKKGTCTIDTYYCRQAREAIAAADRSAVAESEGQ